MSDTTGRDGTTAAQERAAATTREPNRVRVTWAGDQEFDAGRPGGPTARLDGRGRSGQSPVDAVLSGLAACASVDVVEILAKRRTPVRALVVDVAGTRFEGTPRRLVHIHLALTITGAGIDRAQAERAVELAVTKYCSVQGSLDKSIPIEWSIDIVDA